MSVRVSALRRRAGGERDRSGREGLGAVRPEEHAELEALGDALSAVDEDDCDVAGTDLAGGLPEQPEPDLEMLGPHALQAKVRSQGAALVAAARQNHGGPERSEEHTSELQSLMRISYA